MASNVLIFINDSLGELDWIAPFIASDEACVFNFYIFLYAPGRNIDEKYQILNKYGLERDNVSLLCWNESLLNNLAKVESFLNKALNRIKRYSYTSFELLRYVVDFTRLLSSYLLPNTAPKFDFIFRDYNLKDSIPLCRFIQSNRQAKFVIFPHAVGIQRNIGLCPREELKKVKADLWLENSVLSDIAKKNYSDVFYVSGAPGISSNYLKLPLFDVNSNNVLLITRACAPEYGFDLNTALVVFEAILESCEACGLSVKVKHHPRDNKIHKWRSIQSKFNNISEVNVSLSEIDDKLKVCLSFFSTAGLFVSSRRVPVFDISPYHSCDDIKMGLPFHYCDNANHLTHDLIEFGMMERVEFISELNKKITNDKVLSDLSENQFEKIKEYFPENANKLIKTKLLELIS